MIRRKGRGPSAISALSKRLLEFSWHSSECLLSWEEFTTKGGRLRSTGWFRALRAAVR